MVEFALVYFVVLSTYPLLQMATRAWSRNIAERLPLTTGHWTLKESAKMVEFGLVCIIVLSTLHYTGDEGLKEDVVNVLPLEYLHGKCKELGLVCIVVWHVKCLM